MSYALLWIETVAVALLWVAGWMALASKVRRKLYYGLLAFVIVAVPVAVLGGLATVAVILRTTARLQGMYFGYALSLLVICVMGAVVLLAMACHREDGQGARAGSMWPAGRLLLSMLAAAAVWMMTIWNMELAVQSQLSALRAEAGARLLSAVSPVASDARNAAIPYEKAFRRLDSDNSWKKDYDEKHPFNQDEPDMASPAVAEVLSRHAETLTLIRQGAALPDCYFEHDYGRPSFGIAMPELSGLRTATELLRLHARYELAQGWVDSAIDDVNAMLRLSQHAGRSPLLVSSLVAMGMEWYGISTLQEVLPAVKTAEQLKRIALPDPDQTDRMLRRAISTEEAFGLATFCDLGTGNLSPQMITEMIVGMREVGISRVLPQRWGASLYVVFLLDDDVSAYREALSRMRGYSQKPYYVARDQMEQMRQQTAQERRGFCTSLVLPTMDNAFGRAAKARAKANAARAGVAASQYRLERGRLPERLKDLLPAYLKELPIDPFDGKPMRSKVDGKDFVIYSIGPDMKDDGGLEYDQKKRVEDVVFRVKAGQ